MSTLHKLKHKQRTELKTLLKDLDTERKAALKGVKGKKEKKSIVSTFKKEAKVREQDLRTRHQEELTEEQNKPAENVEETNLDDIDTITPLSTNEVEAPTAPTAPTTASLPLSTPITTTNSVDSEISTTNNTNNTTSPSTTTTNADDDAWEQVSHKKNRRDHKSKSNSNKKANKSKGSGSSLINKKALGALTADAICTELRRAKSKKILSLGCRTEAQLVARVRDCVPLVNTICCVDEDGARVQAVMDSIVSGNTSHSTRPRQKTLNVQLMVGSPWYWESEIYEPNNDDEINEQDDVQISKNETVSSIATTATATTATTATIATTKSTTKSSNKTEELMRKVITCGTDTVILGMVLETMPHASCLKMLEQYVVDVLKPNKLILAAANREFNPVYNLHGTAMRDDGHMFEWSRDEFQTWCGSFAVANGYTASHSSVGSPPEQSPHGDVGDAVQIVVFTKQSEKNKQQQQQQQQEQQTQQTSNDLATNHKEEKQETNGKIQKETAIERNLHGYALFSEAAISLFNTWPIFNFSRTHETGGDNTETKIARIIEDVLYNFEERWNLATSAMIRGGERPKLSLVYVDEIAPFLYEVLEGDLSMQLEDESPEVISTLKLKNFNLVKYALY